VLEIKKVSDDKRGSIYSIVGDDLKQYHEIVLLFTKKGFARGGCIHPKNDEHIVIVEGSVEYHIGNDIIPMKNGNIEVIPENIRHYMISKTDSIVIEWGPYADEKNIKDKKYREIVDEINSKVK